MVKIIIGIKIADNSLINPLGNLLLILLLKRIKLLMKIKNS
jgi:hypothetical protein